MLHSARAKGQHRFYTVRPTILSHSIPRLPAPTCPQVSLLEALAEYTSIPVDNTYKTLSVACVLVGIVNVASAGVLYRFDRAF